MSYAVHEMAMIAFSLLGEQETKRIQYNRVRNTGHVSSRIPETAPYNFGINKTWLEMYKDHLDYRPLLVDWDTYPDPEGFGTNKRAVNRGPVPANADLNFDADAESNDD
ncbi:hypothetical protein B0H13DRAFT_1666467 [Mycena leptocephala]|nr:hypothetical protein B0H13DRAFT_1666467 [Mycena leptocephala]